MELPLFEHDASPAEGYLKEDDGRSRALDGVSVLVVEDNAPLRRAIARFLEGAGCIVLEAGAPNEAVTVARAYAGIIDIALIDLILPETSGPECAEMLKDDRPELTVAYMSGYAEQVSDGHAGDDTPVLLTKPFARDELINTLSRLIDRDGRAPA